MTETEEQANDFSHYYNSLTDDQKVMKQSQELSTNKPFLFPLFVICFLYWIFLHRVYRHIVH